MSGHFYLFKRHWILWTFFNGENLLADKKQFFSCLKLDGFIFTVLGEKQKKLVSTPLKPMRTYNLIFHLSVDQTDKYTEKNQRNQDIIRPNL